VLGNLSREQHTVVDEEREEEEEEEEDPDFFDKDIQEIKENAAKIVGSAVGVVGAGLSAVTHTWTNHRVGQRAAAFGWALTSTVGQSWTTIADAAEFWARDFSDMEDRDEVEHHGSGEGYVHSALATNGSGQSPIQDSPEQAGAILDEEEQAAEELPSAPAQQGTANSPPLSTATPQPITKTPPTAVTLPGTWNAPMAAVEASATESWKAPALLSPSQVLSATSPPAPPPAVAAAAPQTSLPFTPEANQTSSPGGGATAQILPGDAKPAGPIGLPPRPPTSTATRIGPCPPTDYRARSPSPLPDSASDGSLDTWQDLSKISEELEKMDDEWQEIDTEGVVVGAGR